MMKTLITIFISVSTILMVSCKKENMVNKDMAGKWVITEYSTRYGYFNSFSTETRTFEFSKYKQAYTRTMKGTYRVDYTDGRLPILDTFEYQLKDDKLEISKVLPDKKVNGVYSYNFDFLRRRFLLSGSASNQITLTRTDTNGFFIRAIKQ